jgi:hypothetical protein
LEVQVIVLSSLSDTSPTPRMLLASLLRLERSGVDGSSGELVDVNLVAVRIARGFLGGFRSLLLARSRADADGDEVDVDQLAAAAVDAGSFQPKQRGQKKVNLPFGAILGVGLVSEREERTMT